MWLLIFSCSSINQNWNLDCAGLLNDLLVFNSSILTWKLLDIKTLSQVPTPRAQHGFSSNGGLLYVHGGYDGEGKEALTWNFMRHLVLSQVLTNISICCRILGRYVCLFSVAGHMDRSYYNQQWNSSITEVRAWIRFCWKPIVRTWWERIKWWIYILDQLILWFIFSKEIVFPLDWSSFGIKNTLECWVWFQVISTIFMHLIQERWPGLDSVFQSRDNNLLRAICMDLQRLIQSFTFMAASTAKVFGFTLTSSFAHFFKSLRCRCSWRFVCCCCFKRNILDHFYSRLFCRSVWLGSYHSWRWYQKSTFLWTWSLYSIFSLLCSHTGYRRCRRAYAWWRINGVLSKLRVLWCCPGIIYFQLRTCCIFQCSVDCVKPNLVNNQYNLPWLLQTNWRRGHLRIPKESSSWKWINHISFWYLKYIILLKDPSGCSRLFC